MVDIFDRLAARQQEQPPDIFDRMAATAVAEPPATDWSQEPTIDPRAAFSGRPEIPLSLPTAGVEPSSIGPQGEPLPATPTLAGRAAKQFANKAALNLLEKSRPSSNVVESVGVMTQALGALDLPNDPTFWQGVKSVPKIWWSLVRSYYAPKNKGERAYAAEELKKLRPGVSFNVPPAETAGEKAVDVTAGIGAFVTQLLVAKKLIPPGTVLPDAVAWEVLNQAEGGIPGKGAAVRGSLGAISKIPTVAAGGKAIKIAAGGGLFGGLTAAEGGSFEDIAVSAAIGGGFQAWGIHKQTQWLKSFKGELLKAEKAKVQGKKSSGMSANNQRFQQDMGAARTRTERAKATSDLHKRHIALVRNTNTEMTRAAKSVDKAMDVIARKLHHGKLKGKEPELARKIVEKGLTPESVAEVGKVKLPATKGETKFAKAEAKALKDIASSDPKRRAAGNRVLDFLRKAEKGKGKATIEGIPEPTVAQKVVKAVKRPAKAVERAAKLAEVEMAKRPKVKMSVKQPPQQAGAAQTQPSVAERPIKAPQEGVKPVKAKEEVSREQNIMDRIDKAYVEKDIATLQGIVSEMGSTSRIGLRTTELIKAIKATEHGLSYNEMIKLQEAGYSVNDILKMNVNKAKEILKAAQPPTKAKPLNAAQQKNADALKKYPNADVVEGTTRVRMRSPKGKVFQVPAGQIEKLMEKGYSLVEKAAPAKAVEEALQETTSIAMQERVAPGEISGKEAATRIGAAALGGAVVGPVFGTAGAIMGGGGQAATPPRRQPTQPVQPSVAKRPIKAGQEEVKVTKPQEATEGVKKEAKPISTREELVGGLGAIVDRMREGGISITEAIGETENFIINEATKDVNAALASRDIERARYVVGRLRERGEIKLNNAADKLEDEIEQRRIIDVEVIDITQPPIETAPKPTAAKVRKAKAGAVVRDPAVGAPSAQGGFVGGRPGKARTKISAIVKEDMKTTSAAESFLRRSKGFKPTKKRMSSLRWAVEFFKEFRFLPYIPKKAEFGNVREAFRHLLEVAKLSHSTAVEDMKHALKPVAGTNIEAKRRMEAVRRKLIADDLYEDMEKGVALPPGLEATDIEAMKEKSDYLYNKYPTVREAYDRIRAATREITDMLVEEGWLNPEHAKEMYFPHKVIKYLRENDAFLGQARKPAEPRKSYLKQRKGGADYSTDVLERLIEHWAQVRRDVETSRFLQTTLKSEQANYFKQEYPEWQQGDEVPPGYKEVTVLPGRFYYKANGVSEDMAMALMLQNLELIETIMDEQNIKGKATIRQMLAVGKKRAYIVREPIARQMLDLPTQAVSDLKAYKAVTAFNTFVKRQILFNPLYAVPFNVTNFIGDGSKNFVALPSALGPKYMVNYWKRIAEAHRGEKSKRFAFAQKYGVIGSGWLGVDVKSMEALIPEIERAEISGGAKMVANKLKRLFNATKTLGQSREDWLRYALFDRLMDLQDKGKNIMKYAIKDVRAVKGITDLTQKAAKIARDIAGDYSAIGKSGRMVSDLLVPFYRWMHLNLPWWPRMIVEYSKRGDVGRLIAALMAAMAPYILSYLWNYSDDDRRKHEQSLPPWKRWQFHVVNRKGTKMYYSPLPLDDVINFIGMDDNMLDYQRYQRGMISFEDLVKRIAINSTYQPGMSLINSVGGFAGVVRDLVGVKTFPDIKPYLETKWDRKAMNVAKDVFGAPGQLGEAIRREQHQKVQDLLWRSVLPVRPYSVDVEKTKEILGKSTYKRNTTIKVDGAKAPRKKGEAHKGKQRKVDSLRIQLEGAK